FFQPPQPVASIAATDFKPGDSIVIDGNALAFPASLDRLSGPVRVQAIFDCDQTERSHEDGPGNVFSDAVRIEVSPEREDAVELTLRHVVEARPLPEETGTLKWVEMRSEML